MLSAMVVVGRKRTFPTIAAIRNQLAVGIEMAPFYNRDARRNRPPAGAIVTSLLGNENLVPSVLAVVATLCYTHKAMHENLQREVIT